MPKLLIDNTPVEVPTGTSVLEAAKQVGIWIPHFCYHPALGSVGACRLCAMKFLEGPVKGIQMSCMIPAQDGMVVSTTDGEAARMREMVIEWLMINHPHDCPVCDEGGECLLQDYTVAGGHGIRRYQGKKRTHINQFLGHNIQHEMNRCIQCYRCVRFYQDYAGGTDFGVMGSAGRVYFGRHKDGPLASPFSGNLVDLCPTGVFTDKTARFRARYWDYEMAPSICSGCSLGCNTVPMARYRELLKTAARHNNAVNGWFICDRGRFDNTAVNHQLRPRTPAIDSRAAEMEEALDAILRRITELQELYGKESLAVVGSPRLSLEGGILLAQLASLLGTDQACFFSDAEEQQSAVAATCFLRSNNAASMQDVRTADCIVLNRCDLLKDGPMMALAVRQAWRNGARIYSVGGHHDQDLIQTISIEMSAVNSISDIPFKDFRSPIILSGNDNFVPDELRHAVDKGARFAFLFAGPNTFGAAMLAQELGTSSLSEAIATGRVKGVISFEADISPPLLTDMKLIVAVDWRRTETLAKAHIVLPSTAWVEMDGTYVNFEGRAQRFKQVMHPGLPLSGLDASYQSEEDQPESSLHPPRRHRSAAPGSGAQPSWQIIAALIERLGGGSIAHPFSGKWDLLRVLSPESEGSIIL